MIMPAWLLLIWCGCAATCAAAVTARAVGGASTATWSLAPLPRSRTHGLAWSIGAGVFAYPVLYGVLFELMHRADLRAGLVLGIVHGAVMFAFVRQRDSTRSAFRPAVSVVVYAVVLAFLYVTP